MEIIANIISTGQSKNYSNWHQEVFFLWLSTINLVACNCILTLQKLNLCHFKEKNQTFVAFQAAVWEDTNNLFYYN